MLADFKFLPEKREFSLVNALACAGEALLAYEKPEEIKKRAIQWGFDENKVDCFTRKQHFGMIMAKNDVLLVAFRGTNERADWLSNLNVLFKKSPLGWVHRGFMSAAELFWPELPQRIAQFRDREQPVWITGHSLGGALAVLSAVKLFKENNIEIAGIYTFGQPPVGTLGFCSKFRKQFENRLFRFINHTDAVADAPILLRKHVGQVRYFDTSGKLWLDSPPWPVSMLDHMRAPQKYGGLAQFTAHPMKEYVKLIEQHVAEEAPHRSS